MQAWDAMGQLLDAGRSWSGRERNCCFLNTRDGRFSAIAGLAGVDHDSDTRAVVPIDWDGDGDLDLWLSNRTGPRIRLLQNQLGGPKRFISLRLSGVRSNRDAIGARVQLLDSTGQPAAVAKTLRAGEGYLSQGSKSLHFALTTNDDDLVAEVRWPSGDKERFNGLVLNQQNRLLEGSGAAEILEEREVIAWIEGESETQKPSDAARILPHSRLPLPELRYRDLKGAEQAVRIVSGSKYQLLSLWATWCTPCLEELKEWQSHQDELDTFGVEVLAVNVDSMDDPFEKRVELVQRFFRRHRLTIQGGMGSSELVSVLDAVQRSVVGRQKPIPVPSSFLLDETGRLLAIYKGRVAWRQLARDIDEFTRGTRPWRDTSLPFAGSWYVGGFGTDLFGLPEKLLEAGLPSYALDFLKQNLNVSLARQRTNAHGEPLAAEAIGVRNQRVGGLYEKTGGLLAQQQAYPATIEAFEGVRLFLPNETSSLINLAMVYRAVNDERQAIYYFREVLRREPAHIPVGNNLAWLLATSRDADLRKPLEAISLAERVCEATAYTAAQPLDTLAVAYAAAGRFSEAIEAGEKAVRLARESGNESLTKSIETRVNLYRANRAYPSSQSAPSDG